MPLSFKASSIIQDPSLHSHVRSWPLSPRFGDDTFKADSGCSVDGFAVGVCVLIWNCLDMGEFYKSDLKRSYRTAEDLNFWTCFHQHHDGFSALPGFDDIVHVGMVKNDFSRNICSLPTPATSPVYPLSTSSCPSTLPLISSKLTCWVWLLHQRCGCDLRWERS